MSSTHALTFSTLFANGRCVSIFTTKITLPFPGRTLIFIMKSTASFTPRILLWYIIALLNCWLFIKSIIFRTVIYAIFLWATASTADGFKFHVSFSTSSIFNAFSTHFSNVSVESFNIDCWIFSFRNPMIKRSVIFSSSTSCLNVATLVLIVIFVLVLAFGITTSFKKSSNWHVCTNSFNLNINSEMFSLTSWRAWWNLKRSARLFNFGGKCFWTAPEFPEMIF